MVTFAAAESTAEPVVQDDEDAAPIVLHMRQVNRNLRQLRRQLGQSDKKAESLKLVQSIQQDLQAAKELEPLKTDDLPSSDRAAFLKDFRSLMDTVISAVEELHGAIEGDDIEKASSLVSKLNDLKREGHEQFQKEEE